MLYMLEGFISIEFFYVINVFIFYYLFHEICRLAVMKTCIAKEISNGEIVTPQPGTLC